MLQEADMLPTKPCISEDLHAQNLGCAVEFASPPVPETHELVLPEKVCRRDHGMLARIISLLQSFGFTVWADDDVEDGLADGLIVYQMSERSALIIPA